MSAVLKFLKKNIYAFVIVAMIVALILNPPRYIQSVYNGLILFATNVLPALFPFFFFTKLLTAVGTANLLAELFKTPARRLYNTPPSSSYILVMSMLSGYPIGAKLIADFYESGLLSTKEARSISAFASTSGPLFVLGTVASLMFKNINIGYIILAAHYIGAILNGLIYRVRGESTCSTYVSPPAQYDNMLSDAATNSVQNILIVGTYIAIFSFVIDFAYDIKLIQAITGLLSYIGVSKELSESILVSLIEVTRGLLLLTGSSLPLMLTVPLASALISFGGLSITLQSITFLSKCKVKARTYLLMKTTQALISGIICYLMCLIFL